MKVRYKFHAPAAVLSDREYTVVIFRRLGVPPNRYAHNGDEEKSCVFIISNESRGVEACISAKLQLKLKQRDECC
jgi:hypothetical protein